MGLLGSVRPAGLAAVVVAVLPGEVGGMAAQGGRWVVRLQPLTKTVAIGGERRGVNVDLVEAFELAHATNNPQA